jgi:hypothetical protein
MFGSLHGKYMLEVPRLLRVSGETSEGDFVQQNMDLMISAVKSPDYDLKNVKIPTRSFPPTLRGVSAAAPVWEHVLVPDCPPVIELFLRNVVCGQFLHKTFYWADGALSSWYNLALSSWASDRLVAMRHIGRCCHLIQDLSVPHHTTVFGNIKEVWNLFSEQSFVQKQYEGYCETQWKPPQSAYNLSEVISVPSVAVNIANASRGYMYLCDGITLPSWLRNSRFRDLFYKLNKLWKEDFYTAATYSNNSAMKYTVLLIHKFFRDVSF